MHAAMSPEDIREVVRLKEYRAARPMLFPSDGALEWHWRRHRARYANAGAVLINGNKVFVHPRRFDEVFASIAHEDTLAKLAGAESEAV